MTNKLEKIMKLALPFVLACNLYAGNVNAKSVYSIQTPEIVKCAGPTYDFSINQKRYKIQPEPDKIKLLDFEKDGDTDIFFRYNDSQENYIALNDGKDRFSKPKSIPINLPAASGLFSSSYNNKLICRNGGNEVKFRKFVSLDKLLVDSYGKDYCAEEIKSQNEVVPMEKMSKYPIVTYSGNLILRLTNVGRDTNWDNNPYEHLIGNAEIFYPKSWKAINNVAPVTNRYAEVSSYIITYTDSKNNAATYTLSNPNGIYSIRNNNMQFKKMKYNAGEKGSKEWIQQLLSNDGKTN